MSKDLARTAAAVHAGIEGGHKGCDLDLGDGARVDQGDARIDDDDRAHLLVHYELPDWEAPDSEVQTTLHLRREAAAYAREDSLFDGLPVEVEDTSEGLVVKVPAGVDDDTVDGWATARFPDRYERSATGNYFDEDGSPKRRSTLAVVEVLIADLANRMTSGLTRAPAG